MHDSPLFSRKIFIADKNYTQMLGATNHTCVKIIVLGNTHTHSSLVIRIAFHLSPDTDSSRHTKTVRHTNRKAEKQKTQNTPRTIYKQKEEPKLTTCTIWSDFVLMIDRWCMIGFMESYHVRRLMTYSCLAKSRSLFSVLSLFVSLDITSTKI